MPDLPSGTVTFLFTDIEGSTSLVQELGDRYQGLLEDHNRLLRKAVTQAGGLEVSTEGDGFFGVFTSAADALAGVVAAQQALASHPWPEGRRVLVRMGLHTGAGVVGGDNYVGLDVHRAARLMAAAHGGQIVVSESTYVLVRDDLVPPVGFRDLGPHRLKDLARSEHVYQVVHPDLRVEFPPLRSLEGFPNNLPAQLSTFVGRRELLLELRRAIEASRLVTLIGPGGVGKTRLALQVAADRIERHPDGVWLVELGRLTDPDLIPQAARSALGVDDYPGRSSLATVIGYLQGKDLLMVMDNCEHLVDAAAALVETVLGASARVRVMATSREPLNVSGEVTWPILPLLLPVSDEAFDAENPSEAVELFVERARAADPGFELTERNAPAVAAICRRLDGLPLAIELVASRVRSLSVEDIAARLEKRLPILAAGARTGLPRQRTLEATVAWSYDLLEPPERSVFTRLGMFAGPFDLNAAEEVGAGGDVERDQVVHVLSALVDKSLLAVLHEDESVRYRMLETIRDFSRMRLAETQEMARVEAAHTGWALGFAQRAQGQMIGPDMPVWIRRVRDVFDDLRAVVERSLERGDPETGLRLVTALDPYLNQMAVREGAYWLDRLFEVGDVGPDLLAPALSLRGELLILDGETERAADVLERALELYETADDSLGKARAQLLMAAVLWDRSDPEEVHRLLLSALDVFEALRHPTRHYPICLFVLALWELEFGDSAHAGQYATRLEQLGEMINADMVKAHAAEVFGLMAHFGGDPELARARFADAVVHYRRAGLVLGCLVHCLGHIAMWTLGQGNPAQTATLLGSIETLREAYVGMSTPVSERIWHDQTAASARRQLGAAFDADFSKGKQMDPEGALEFAAGSVAGERRSTG